MLTAIIGRRWVIRHDLRLAVIKCAKSPDIRQAFANVVFARLAKGMSEGLKYGIEHGKDGRDLADVKSYDPEANNKLVKALQDLKDLKYLMVDQLEKLKDAPIELIMAFLHLESDTREDAPQRGTVGGCYCGKYKSGGEEKEVQSGLAILLMDAGTQTQRSKDETSTRLL
ncbi:hypothetical protein Tco_1531243, partial [Tanacetum coccineum]